MSASILVVVALATASVAWLVSGQHARAAIAALGLSACIVVALASPSLASIAVGNTIFALGTHGAGVSATAAGSLLLLLGAAAAGGRRSLTPALPVSLPVTLAALVAVLAAVDGSLLANPLPGRSGFQAAGTDAFPVALAIVTAASVAMAPLAAWQTDPARAAAARRAAARAVRVAIVACGLGLAGMAWLLAPAGPIAPDPAGVAAALLIVSASVALFMGALPFHSFAVRAHVEGPVALTVARGVWLPAAFALAAAAWSQRVLAPAVALSGVGGAPLFTDARGIVAIVALVTLAGGALAATFHDDLRHVLAYALVGDAGLALLAFSSADPATASAVVTWLPINAVARTALVAWAVALVLARGTGFVDDLDGWARDAPLLGVALVGIAAATFGLPGWEVFALRGSLVAGGGGWLSPVMAAAAWLGLLPYLRLAWVGARPRTAGAEGPVVSGRTATAGPGEHEPDSGAGRRPPRVPLAGESAARRGATRMLAAWGEHAALVAAACALLAAVVAIALAWSGGGTVAAID